MQVDDPGRQGEAVGIDGLTGALQDVARELADRGDPPVLDRDVGAAWRVAQPVDHGRAADHQLVHGFLLIQA